MHTPEALEDRFTFWLAYCQGMINKHYADNLPNLTPPTLSVTKNPRWWRVVSRDNTNDGHPLATHGSVYCFIDPATGDVLKADGWRTPAKTPRGNLFDDSNGTARMTVYGAAYNR